MLDIYLEFGFYLEQLSSIYKTGKEGAEIIAGMMENFRNSPPEVLAGSKVILVNDYLNSSSMDRLSGSISPISLPKSNVLQYVTEDQSRISIRPSGTEPKIKFYFSVKGSLKERSQYPDARQEMETKITQIKKELGIE